jgi:tRNA (mo5U34)-methyltransferase
MQGDGAVRPIGEAELRQELERLSPFHHDIALPYGLRTDMADLSGGGEQHTRVQTLVQHGFPALLDVFGGSLDGLGVLDVACNCGGFSFAAADRGASRVLGFDIVPRYVEQAELIRRALGLEQTEFRLMSIDDVTPESAGTFDVTLCFGILYHLEDPIGAMRRLAEVTTSAMLVDTNITRVRFAHQPLWRMNFPPPPSASRGRTGEWRSERPVVQFSPTAEAVEALLRFLGFARVDRLPASGGDLEKRYREGTRATFLAVR